MSMSAIWTPPANCLCRVARSTSTPVKPLPERPPERECALPAAVHVTGQALERVQAGVLLPVLRGQGPRRPPVGDVDVTVVDRRESVSRHALKPGWLTVSRVTGQWLLLRGRTTPAALDLATPVQWLGAK